MNHGPLYAGGDITGVPPGGFAAERRDPLRRIAADNDPRNGTVAERLTRMIEHPELEPDEDGLYPDV